MCFKKESWDFPGRPVIKIPHFHCRGVGSIPGLGPKISHTTWHSQILKKKKKESSPNK